MAPTKPVGQSSEVAELVRRDVLQVAFVFAKMAAMAEDGESCAWSWPGLSTLFCECCATRTIQSGQRTESPAGQGLEADVLHQ